jgi:hypothetical protein
VLWAGWPFFELGWTSVVSRHLNMFTLIAMGVGAAYAFSVVATLAPGAFPPTPRLALQLSAGHLTEAERCEAGAARSDVNRIPASATYHHPARGNGIWATTLAWGRNAEPDHASNAWLVETSVTPDQRNTWFGRFEVTGKTAHDLDVPEPPDHFTVATLQGGYTRYLTAWNGFQPGLGGALSVGMVPDSLKSIYGSRANFGFAVYLTLRPAAAMPATRATTPAPIDHTQHIQP